jgi:hypothetical protein
MIDVKKPAAQPSPNWNTARISVSLITAARVGIAGTPILSETFLPFVVGRVSRQPDMTRILGHGVPDNLGVTRPAYVRAIDTEEGRTIRRRARSVSRDSKESRPARD